MAVGAFEVASAHRPNATSYSLLREGWRFVAGRSR
jgi:hypothetical protein